jgi:hypothetical protein
MKSKIYGSIILGVKKMTNFVFKSNAAEYHGTEDEWYAISNGYIKPEKMLSDKQQVKIIKDAVGTLKEFFEQCQQQGLIGEEDCD